MNPVGAVFIRGIILFFYMILYPVGGGLTSVIGSLLFAFLAGTSADPQATKRAVLAGVIAAVVAWFTVETTAKAEQYCARSKSYRALRYVTRILTYFAVGVVGDLAYIESKFGGSSIPAYERILGDTTLGLFPVIVTVLMTAAMHSERMRMAWHDLLEQYGIHPNPPEESPPS